MSTVIVPAYNPDEKLIGVIEDIKSYNVDRIIVVNDGSKEECNKIFDDIEKDAIILVHRENRGKGTAIKTAMKYIRNLRIEDKILIVDADGQHKMSDGIRLLETLEIGKKEIVTGRRNFKGKIPFKNKLGNLINKYTFMLLSGKKVGDTLNGLRAFGTNLIDFLLSIEGKRYEYEINVLVQCVKNRVNIKEVDVEVLYFEGNKSSHFRALIDSVKIYGTMLIYLGSSLISFVIDYIIFLIGFYITNNLAFSNIVARIISATCNFLLNSKVVFRQNKIKVKQIIQYTLLALVVLAANTTLLHLITNKLPLPAVTKIITEIIIFIFNYIIQKKVIFNKEND